jgi:hypothetical protein
MNQKEDDEDNDNDYNYFDAAEDMEESDEFDTQYQEIRKRMNELYETPSTVVSGVQSLPSAFGYGSLQTQKTDLFNDIANTNAAKKNANDLERAEALSTANDEDSRKSYKYSGLKMLIKKDVGQYIQNSGYMERAEGDEKRFNSVDVSRRSSQGNIYICAYQVNTTGQLPFLQFVMTRSKQNTMSLPIFMYTNTPNILEMCKCTLDLILSCLTSMSIPQHKYQGFAQDGNNFYVFFDFSQYNLESQHFLLQDEIYLVLIDEFINHKQIGKYTIDKTAIDFFSINPELLYLTDGNNNNYETPAVLYSGNIGKMVDFTYIFGVSKSTTEYFNDPQYYFTNYANAIEQSNELKKKYEDEYPGSFTTRGVIRFAVFLGSMEIYSSDHLKPGSMTDFQSIYLKNNTHSYWIVKNYEQQTSLSTHNI